MFQKSKFRGHAIARGWATLLIDRLRDFVVAPSSVGGNSSSMHNFQGVEERATLDRYHHFHGHSCLCVLKVSQGASPLISVVEIILLRVPVGPRGLELDARGKGGELTPFSLGDFKEIYLLDNCVVLCFCV